MNSDIDIEHTINRIKSAEKHVEPKLVQRLKIFAGIISIMMIVVIYKIYLREVDAFLAVIGLLIGVGIGFIAGRMFKMSWHLKTQKVVSSMDVMGVIFLVLYVLIEIGRKWFFGHWMQGAQLNAFGLAFLAGLLLGRLLSMLKAIEKVLLEEKKIT